MGRLPESKVTDPLFFQQNLFSASCFFKPNKLTLRYKYKETERGR